MAQNDLDLFARRGGWGELEWTPLDEGRRDLFSHRGTLLIGLEDDHERCVLAWINENRRWRLVPGLVDDGRGATQTIVQLEVVAEIRELGKVRILLSIDRQAPDTLKGRLWLHPSDFSEEDLGTFTAKANPIGDEYLEPRQEEPIAI